MNPRWLAPLLVSAAVSATPRAVAEVTLRPAADGQVGAWLVSGPLPLDQARALAEKGAAPSAAGAAPRFRLLHSRDGALDLDRALGTGRKSGSAALLGGTLVLDSDLDGVLLASIDGAARLYLGEKPIWDRPARALRGGGWDAIPLRLPRGSHQLVLVLEHPGNWWALELRLLDARNLLAPSGARVTLAGTTDADADRLTSSLLDLSLHAGAGPSAFLPKLLIDFPRGTPLEASVPLRATVRAGTTRYELELGRLPLGPHGVSPYEATLPSLDPRALGGATTLRARAEDRQAQPEAQRSPASKCPVAAGAGGEGSFRSRSSTGQAPRSDEPLRDPGGRRHGRRPQRPGSRGAARGVAHRDRGRT